MRKLLPPDHRPDRDRQDAVAVTRRSWLCGVLGSAVLGGCATAGRLPIDDQTWRSDGQDSRVLFLILHYTNGTLAASARTLIETDVSAHYLLSDESPPRIYRLVDEDRRAWHAGVSQWGQHGMLNSASIGIEIVNPGMALQADGRVDYTPFPPAQIDLLIVLMKDIVQRHGIRPERILAHADIAPQRRSDPGPLFPWQRLVDEGLIPWPAASDVRAARPRFDAELPDIAWFQRQLAAMGYAVPVNGEADGATRRVLAVFQMKYRPARYDGEPDAETAALLQVMAETVR